MSVASSRAKVSGVFLAISALSALVFGLFHLDVVELHIWTDKGGYCVVVLDALRATVPDESKSSYDSTSP